MEKFLKDLTIQVRGVSYKPSDLRDANTGVPLLRANNISDNQLTVDDVVFVDPSKVSEKQYLQDGDIVICASSGSKNLVGKAAVYHGERRKVTFGAFCKVVRSKTNGFKEYLSLFFRSPKYRLEISEKSHGANINNIKTEDIDEMSVLVHNEKTIETICQQLNSIIAGLENKKASLLNLDSLVKSRFMEMFGDPNHNDLSKSLSLEKCVTIRDEMRKPINGVTRAKMQAGELFPYYGATGQVGTINEYLSDFEALCIAEDCGNYGPNEESTYVISGKCWVNNHAHLIQCNKNVDIRYLQHYLNFLDIRQYINGATRSKLTQSALKTLPILVPSVDQQLEFKRTIELIDKSRFVCHSRNFL